MRKYSLAGIIVVAALALVVGIVMSPKDATAGDPFYDGSTLSDQSNNLTTAYTAADTALSGQVATAYVAADVALSGQVTVAFTAADVVISNQAYASAVAAMTAQVDTNAFVDTTLTTPRRVGDVLLGTVSNLTYHAFGATTNDWN